MKKIIFCLTVCFTFLAMGINLSVAQTPTISSFTPSSGVVGSSVTITGTNFDPVPSNNTVFFGGVRASVTAASSTSLDVSVPSGAAYSTISVTRLGLTATSTGYFNVTFPNGDGSTMSPPINDSVGNYPLGVAVGDFNGDGKLDMAVANSGSNSVSILLGTGTGTFGPATNYGVGSSPYGVTVGDFNGDGNLDVAVTDYSGNAVSVLLGTGTGTFGAATNYPVGFFPFGIAVGDFNGDGKLDLAVTNLDSDSLSILLGTGTGTFGTATNYGVGHQPSGIVVGDFNGDGKLDVAVANQQGGVGNNGSVSVLLGNGDGTFGTTTNYSAGSAPNSITAGDFNGDGNLDLAVTSSTGNNNVVSVILGSGTGTFGAATQYPGGNTPLFITTGDFNGDGKLDVALANQNGNSVSILLGTGTGAFDSAANYSVGVVPYGITVGDFNGDGRADLAVANYLSSNVSVLLNVPPGFYTILSSVNSGNGTITPLGATEVSQGNTQVYTLTPNTAYHIDSVFVDGSYVGNASPDTISNVTSNHTISVKFAINTYTITSSVTGGNGTIAPLGTANVNYGSNQIYTITPNTGYHIDSVFVDGSYVGNTSPDTLKNITVNHAITVKFASNTFTITSSVIGGNGGIAPSGTTTVNYGANQIFTATPNTGYHIDSVFVDGSYVGNASRDTISNVTSNHTISVKFAINTYTITSSVTGGNGTIAPLGTTNVSYGSNQIYTITPNTGYHIDSVFVDGGYIGNISPDTMKNVTANHTVTVKFAINTYTISVSAGINGIISPSGPVVVPYGGSQAFTITANPGYHIDSVFADGISQGAIAAYSFSNITSNHSLSATFAMGVFLSSPDTLNKGWNIVSVPLTVTDYHKTVLFPTAISEAFAYLGSYEIKSILANDVGYWLKSAVGQTVTISGFSRVSDTIGVISGWNLIGSLSNPIDVASIVSNPSGIILSNFFGYQTGYNVVSAINPGKGYWIKVSQNGSLVLNESKSVPKSASQENPLEQLNKLEVTDAAGNTQTLYFGPAESRYLLNLEKYELPPVPPSGIFDVRFASSNIITLADSLSPKTVSLQISATEYPLKINWDIIAHNNGSSSFMTIGTRTVTMKESGTVDVISGEDQISLTLKPQAQNEVPLEYTLHQNYPNPFNPTATIKYDLPVASYVSLKIFNTLGQVVATLTDGVEGAGYKSVQWNAGGFASGVYIYRISATSQSDPNKNFTQVRKMVLVK